MLSSHELQEPKLGGTYTHTTARARVIFKELEIWTSGGD